MAITMYAGRDRASGLRPYRAAAAGYAPDWSRRHAAAIDRSIFDRDTPAEVTPAEQPSKRLLDLALALLLVVTLSPVLLTIAFLVQLDGGSVLFGHRRIGRHGHTFVCWKFRTMVVNAEQVLEKVLANNPEARAEWEATYKLKRDPRITRLGQFLRTSSLDELPQLINVLLGEMSLVGPRPIVADEVNRYGGAFHDYARCRPGITGAWQVSGRNDCDYGNRVRLDRDYARGWSLLTDLGILWKTAFVVIKRTGAY